MFNVNVQDSLVNLKMFAIKVQILIKDVELVKTRQMKGQ